MDTSHGIVFDLLSKENKNRQLVNSYYSFLFGTRQKAASLLFPTRQQVEDDHPSVRSGGGCTLLRQLESNWLTLTSSSILPA